VLGDGDGFSYDGAGASENCCQLGAIEIGDGKDLGGQSLRNTSRLAGRELREFQLRDKKDSCRFQLLIIGRLETAWKERRTENYEILCEALLFGWRSIWEYCAENGTRPF
jgi:hypothetical protein